MRIRLEALNWHRPCAAWIVCVGLAVYTVLNLSGFTGPFLASVLVSLWSMKLLFLILPILLIPHIQRRAWEVLILLPILLCCLWQVASLELYAVQCHFFSYAELCSLIGAPETRSLVWEQVLSLKVLFFIFGFYTFYFLIAYGFKRWIPITYGALLVPIVVFFFAWGEYFVAQRHDRTRSFQQQQLACMPWSWLSFTNQGEPVADLASAQHWWCHSDPSFWAPGASSYINHFSAVADRYKGRSIVVIVMESQGLNYVDDYGAASTGYRPSSPYLAKLAREHQFFLNYIQAGYATRSAAWSLLSGFPYFNETAYTPQLAKLGPISAFQDAGYAVDWLQSTNVKFASFNELSQNLQISTGLRAEEERDLHQHNDFLWSAWGMPDHQLYEVVHKRVQKSLATDAKPFLQFILTVSNHIPFHLPESIDGVSLPADNSGGMRYADKALEQFMQNIAQIDEPQRPIVFITADTGFRSVNNLVFDPNELSVEPIESLRIPGVLVLPDKYVPTAQFDSMFTHEDLLGFLAHVVGVPCKQAERLEHYQRLAVALNDYEGHTIINQTHYLYAGVTLTSIINRWQLELAPNEGSEYEAMLERRRFMKKLQNEVWINGGIDTLYRDQHWEFVESYNRTPKSGPTVE